MKHGTVPAASVLLGVRTGTVEPHLNVLLDSLKPAFVFAGVRTALTAGIRLAEGLGLPIRFVVVRPAGMDLATTDDEIRSLLAGIVGREPMVGVTVVRADDVHGLVVSPDDVWLATFWTTAYAVAELELRGDARRGRIAYLVQDFEPGFFPWSDQYVNALSTYGKGFHCLVNSQPLARFLDDRAGLRVNDAQVFEPAIDRARLSAVAPAWAPSERIRLLMYGRPGHPRNLFGLSLETLATWVESLPLDTIARLEIRSAGDVHPEIDLGSGVTVQSLGKLAYDDYYRQLAQSDLGLALMYSPHPGHLALEMPMTGVPTVTNQMLGYRAEWVPGLLVREPSPRTLANGLTDALSAASSLRDHAYRELDMPLGRTLEAVLDDLAERLRSGAPAEAVAVARHAKSGRGATGELAMAVAELAQANALIHGREEEVTALGRRVVAADERLAELSTRVADATRRAAGLERELAAARALNSRKIVRPAIVAARLADRVRRRIRRTRVGGWIASRIRRAR